MKRALVLATRCQHPEARWLMEVFAGRVVNTADDAFAVLEEKDDSRSLCFAAWLSRDKVRLQRSLQRSAELGYAFAQSLMAEQTDGTEKYDWASRAALQGERDGYYWLGLFFYDGYGCEGDKEKAKANFLKAANLK